MKNALLTIAVLLLSCTFLHAATEPPSPITITNYADNATIRHPVPLLRGTISDTSIDSVTITNRSSKRPTRKITGLAHKGAFLCLAELIPGPNKLVIRAGKHRRRLTINYKPQTNPHVIRVIYLTDSTGRTDYQSPIENDPRNYRDKLDTAMKLMQTFTAERMYDLGFGRVTFNLELDHQGKVKVHTLKGDRTAQDYYKLTGLELWSHANRLVPRKIPHPSAKNLVIPAFTRFDPKTGKTNAHTALGGGHLALFGGANLFTWPSTITDAHTAFMDTTIIDTKNFFSDSVGRNTFWATASTTIGAALHELGHTLGLPHSKHPHDIMTRGFDRFNRAFTLIEPPHARRKDHHEFTPDQIASFNGPSAAWLKFSRYFTLDKKDFAKDTITAEFHPPTESIIVRSAPGIGAVTLNTKGNANAHVPLDYTKAPPQKVEIPLDKFKQHLTGDKARIRIINAHGNSKTVNLTELIPQPTTQTRNHNNPETTSDD